MPRIIHNNHKEQRQKTIRREHEPTSTNFQASSNICLAASKKLPSNAQAASRQLASSSQTSSKKHPSSFQTASRKCPSNSKPLPNSFHAAPMNFQAANTQLLSSYRAATRQLPTSLQEASKRMVQARSQGMSRGTYITRFDMGSKSQGAGDKPDKSSDLIGGIRISRGRRQAR